MPKKLTKHQRQYRKRQKEAQKDFVIVKKESPYDGVRVARKRLKVWVSQEAYDRLVQLAAETGIKQWEMLTRILLKSLPRYASLTDSTSPTKRYAWPESLLKPAERSVRYKGAKGERQIGYDITSTAWKKLECHKTTLQQSKSRIVQSLILNYKPLTPEQLERQRWLRECDARERDEWIETTRTYKEAKPSHLLNTGGGVIIHKKGIPMEYWDAAEWLEYSELMTQHFEETLKRLVAKEMENSDEYRFWLKRQQEWEVEKVAYHNLGEKTNNA